MRLWSLHPSILDRAALVAGWRETLLAQKVLASGTKGYTNHPQLIRFRAHPEPLRAVGAYLQGLHEEATARGYSFNASKILEPAPASGTIAPIPVTDGQLAYELEHLRAKVTARAPEWLPHLPEPGTAPAAHPLLQVAPGPVEDWEVR